MLEKLVNKIFGRTPVESEWEKLKQTSYVKVPYHLFKDKSIKKRLCKEENKVLGAILMLDDRHTRAKTVINLYTEGTTVDPDYLEEAVHQFMDQRIAKDLESYERFGISPKEARELRLGYAYFENGKIIYQIALDAINNKTTAQDDFLENVEEYLKIGSHFIFWGLSKVGFKEDQLDFLKKMAKDLKEVESLNHERELALFALDKGVKEYSSNLGIALYDEYDETKTRLGAVTDAVKYFFEEEKADYAFEVMQDLLDKIHLDEPKNRTDFLIKLMNRTPAVGPKSKIYILRTLLDSIPTKHNGVKKNLFLEYAKVSSENVAGMKYAQSQLEQLGFEHK
jgi:hypothetical protein